ncbi:multicopper oxidase domain-containing protein [Methylovulum miyakonense]|uniref:multicopper oxidase domain-containing protein n=1 Tax=Methylovulum miyakonense TaxID=645578 RepID=UPI0003684080|nr:multicopper oxidase domain-containing protein [Methylovulum miyakonense]
MMTKKHLALSALLVAVLATTAVQFFPKTIQPAGITPPSTVYNRSEETSSVEKPCSNEHPEWREAQMIEGVDIAPAPACEPDNPYEVATSVKGTNNVSMMTLMQTDLAQDALVMGEDVDNDGDPDEIHIKLEVVELNGSSPDGEFLINTYPIAPGIQPGLWVYAPKSRGMALKNFNSVVAIPMLRAPSPTIRVEQGDKVFITLENTHYLPHTIHLHGVDHAFHNSKGEDNDGTEEHAVFPGKSHTYEIQPRHAGTMLYHCHVQTAQHFMMGLHGMFVVEENHPNNWVQTFNVGAGQVRHPSVGVKNTYSQEYDLIYQSIDKKLSQIIQNANDPRLVAQRMSRDYNMTESFENYFLLNGHSFPYTLRDGIIAVNDNENIKLRIANVQRSPVAIHFHGHKATITAYDGVDQAEVARITRDVFDIAPAQRIDLQLSTQNNGVNSYGPGLWMFHDHVATGTTSDGMEPGGNMAILAYKPMLDENGMPTMHDDLLNEVFSKDYYAKKQALWAQGDFKHLLGDAGLIVPPYWQIILFGLAAGLLIGLALVFTLKRKQA